MTYPTITNRAFGVEVEFVGANPRVVQRALAAAGVECSIEGYNHITRSHWKLTSDASLHSVRGYAAELVSPILQGTQGVRELERVLEALNSVEGVTVNRSCGLHIHLDSRDMTVAQIAKTYDRYAEYEEQIDLVMPRSRRLSPRWCGSLQNYKGIMSDAPTKVSLANRLGRYFKVNLTNVSSRGSIEFRQHSGTTEFRKVVHWLSFLMQFVERSIELCQPSANGKTFRYYKAFQELAARHNVTMTYRRGQKSWDVYQGAQYLGRLPSQDLDRCYAGMRLLSSRAMLTLLNLGMDRSVRTDRPEDGGLLDSICEKVRDYFAERQEELA